MEINQVKELVSTVDTTKFPFVADLIAANPAIAPESEDDAIKVEIPAGTTVDNIDDVLEVLGSDYTKVNDTTVKDAEGKEYTYEVNADGTTITLTPVKAEEPEEPKTKSLNIPAGVNVDDADEILAVLTTNGYDKVEGEDDTVEDNDGNKYTYTVNGTTILLTPKA